MVVRHNNQPIVGGSNMIEDGEDAWPGWGVWGGCFLYFGAANRMEYDEEVDIAAGDDEYAVGDDS